MDFGNALSLLKGGKTAARTNWQTQGTVSRVYLVTGSTFKVNRPPLNAFYPEGSDITYQPHIDALYKDQSCGVWTPTQADILAEDWAVFESIS